MEYVHTSILFLKLIIIIIKKIYKKGENNAEFILDYYD